MHAPLAVLVPSLALALSTGCGAPGPPGEPERPVVVVGVDAARGQRTADSVYWYTGARPESVVVRGGVGHVALPAGALGQRVVRAGDDCDGIRPPHGALREVARRARAVLGVDTVVVTQARLMVERRTWSGSRVCGEGPSLARFDASYLDADRP